MSPAPDYPLPDSIRDAIDHGTIHLPPATDPLDGPFPDLAEGERFEATHQAIAAGSDGRLVVRHHLCPHCDRQVPYLDVAHPRPGSWWRRVWDTRGDWAFFAMLPAGMIAGALIGDQLDQWRTRRGQ